MVKQCAILQCSILFLLNPLLSTGQEVEALTRLRSDVFDNYIPVIPLCDSGAVEINFNFSLFRLGLVSDIDESTIISAWYTMTWIDCFLKWNESQYDSVEFSEFPTTLRVWTPDLTWLERLPSVDAFEFEDGLFSGTRAYIYSSGLVLQSRELLMRSYCPMELSYFPFDQQECSISFVAWSYAKDQVVFINGTAAGSLEDLMPSDSWTIVAFPVVQSNLTDNSTGLSYSTLQYKIVMARKPIFYLFYLMLPFFVISLLNSFVFLIPPKTNEKISFALSILLSLSVYMMLMMQITPPKAEIPIISMYFFTIFVLSSLSAGLAVMIEVAQIKHSLQRPPKVLSTIFLRWLGRFKYFQLLSLRRESQPSDATSPSSTQDAATNITIKPEVRARIEGLSPHEHICEWRQISFAVDRFLFLLYTVASLAVFLTLFFVGFLQEQNPIV